MDFGKAQTFIPKQSHYWVPARACVYVRGWDMVILDQEMTHFQSRQEG
jgi:hypothetical protein